MGSTTARHVALVHSLFAVTVLVPFLSASVPGLGDTLNHLARMHVLATIDRSPALQRFYEVHWSAIPYLAMDAVVPSLLHAVPIYLAGKLFVAACVVLPVLGVAAIHYAVHRRPSLVPCAAWLVATNGLLALGFLNFLFTLGLALLLFAGWIATTGWPRWRRAALFALCVLALYFGHAFGCASYCLAVLGWEGARAWRMGRRPAGAVLADLAACLAQAVPALLCAATLDLGAGSVGGLHTVYGSPGDKVAALLSPALFLHDAAHGLVLAASLGVAAVLGMRVRLHRALWPAVLPVGIAACAVPHVLASTWGTDLRLPLVVVLLAMAALSVRIGRPGRVAVLGALLVLVAARSADSWVALREVDAQFAQTRAVLAHLPRGARLLVVALTGHGTGGERVPLSTQWNMPMVASIERDAFLPTLFTGLTTVRVRPALRASATPNGLPVSPAQLRAGEGGDPGRQEDDGQGARFYHVGWERSFDYVLVQRLGGDPGMLPRRLAPVATSGGLDLYRVASP